MTLKVSRPTATETV